MKKLIFRKGVPMGELIDLLADAATVISMIAIASAGVDKKAGCLCGK